MKLEYIDQNKAKALLSDILAETDFSDADPSFSCMGHGSNTYIWVEFDTELPSINLSEMEKLKRIFKKHGVKVTQITAYPLASCKVSIRIATEF